MIHHLRGATDLATMVLFDPQALPEGFDARFKQRRGLDEADSAARRGELYQLHTDDGEYRLGVCLGEEPPELTAPGMELIDMELVGKVDRLLVPGGTLYFTGVEFMFRDDDSALARHPDMKAEASCHVPPGVYRLRLYETDYREETWSEAYDQRLAERASAAGIRLVGIMRRHLLPLAMLGTFGGLISLVLLGWREWRVTFMPVSLAMILPAALLSRTRTYREAAAAGRDVAAALMAEAAEIDLDFPSYWAVLEPVE